MHAKLAVALALSITLVGTALAKTQTGDHGTVTAVEGHASYVELIGVERENTTQVELTLEVRCPQGGPVQELVDQVRSLLAQLSNETAEACAFLENPFVWLVPSDTPVPRPLPEPHPYQSTTTVDGLGRHWTVHEVRYLTMDAPTEAPEVHRAWIVPLEPGLPHLRLHGATTVHALVDPGPPAPGAQPTLELQVLLGPGPGGADTAVARALGG